jgi:hypothetical protein
VHCPIPAEEGHIASHESAVVGDDGGECRHQLATFGTLAAVEADGLACIAQPHQRIPECGVGELISE